MVRTVPPSDEEILGGSRRRLPIGGQENQHSSNPWNVDGIDLLMTLIVRPSFHMRYPRDCAFR
jgi:hypothetical protein